MAGVTAIFAGIAGNSICFRNLSCQPGEPLSRCSDGLPPPRVQSIRRANVRKASHASDVGSTLAHFYVLRNACASPIHLCSFVVVPRFWTVLAPINLYPHSLQRLASYGFGFDSYRPLQLSCFSRTT